MKYNFKNYLQSDITFLIQAINVLGEDLVGLELGVLRGDSSMTILHNCSIKKLYLIDNWKPYYDYLKTIPDGQPASYMDEINQEVNEFLTRHKIKNFYSLSQLNLERNSNINEHLPCVMCNYHIGGWTKFAYV